MNRVCFLLLLLVLTCRAHAQTLRPQIAQVTPVGAQRGTTVTVTLTGINVGYATQLLIDGKGFTIEKFSAETPPPNAKNPNGKSVAQIKIAPGTLPGRYPLRLLTSLGISDVGYFVVGEWPERAEKEPNNTRSLAQTLPFPITVGGHSDGAEDVDVYHVLLQKDETVVFSAAAGSIGSSLTPVLTLQDVTGREQGFAAALSQSDTLLTFTAPKAGDYYLFLRDLRYQGGPAFYYRLTVGKMPAVTSIFPLGGRVGTDLHVALAGTNLPTPPERTLTLPTEPPVEPLALPDIGNRRVEVGTLPEVLEAEPNDKPDTAQRVTLPVTINGRLSAPNTQGTDVDCFRFTTTKGQVLNLEVMAARLGSPLDAVLSVLDVKGKELATNDDARGRDAALTFTAPETGEYIARISDLTNRSGDAFTYRLHLAPAVPDFQLAFSPDCLTVAPGDRVPFTVTAARQNGFDGEIAFTVDGLPAGVHLSGTPVIGKGQNTVTLIADADANATQVALPLRIMGTAQVASNAVVRRAQSRERSYVKRDDKVEETSRPVPFAWAAITGPADFTLAAPGERLPLTIGKTAELKVTANRKAGFTAKIPLTIQGLPAGITVTGAEIPEGKNEAVITLKAETNVAVGEATLTLIGRSIVDELRFTDHLAPSVLITVTK